MTASQTDPKQDTLGPTVDAEQMPNKEPMAGVEVELRAVLSSIFPVDNRVRKTRGLRVRESRVVSF